MLSLSRIASYSTDVTWSVRRALLMEEWTSGNGGVAITGPLSPANEGADSAPAQKPDAPQGFDVWYQPSTPPTDASPESSPALPPTTPPFPQQQEKLPPVTWALPESSPALPPTAREVPVQQLWQRQQQRQHCSASSNSICGYRRR